MPAPNLISEFTADEIATSGSLVPKPEEIKGTPVDTTKKFMGAPNLVSEYNAAEIKEPTPLSGVDAKRAIEMAPVSNATGIPIDTLYSNPKEVNETVQRKRDEGIVRSATAEWRIGEWDLQRSRIGEQMLMGIDDPDFERRLGVLNKKIADESQYVTDDNIFEKTINSLVSILPVAIETGKEGLRGGMTTAMLYGGATLFVDPPLAPAAFFAGMAAGTTAFGSKEIAEIEAGSLMVGMYNLVDDQGNPIDQRLVKTFAMTGGVINGALEAVGIKMLLNTVPGLNKVVSETVQKAIVKLMKDGSIPRYLVKSAGRYSKFITGEVAIEVGQEIVTMTMEETAKGLHEKYEDGMMEHLSVEDVVERIKETAITSALAFGAMGAPGHSIHTASGLIDQQSQVKEQRMKDILPDDKDPDYQIESKNTFERIKNVFFSEKDTRIVENRNEGRQLKEEVEVLLKEGQKADELAIAMQLYRDSKNNPEAVEAALRGERYEVPVEEPRPISRGFEGVPTQEQQLKDIHTPVVDQQSLETVGNAIAYEMGITDSHTWEFMGEKDEGFRGRYLYKQKKIRISTARIKNQEDLRKVITHELLHSDPKFRYMPDGIETISGKELKEMSPEERAKVIPGIEKARKHPKEFHDKLDEILKKIPKEKKAKKLTKPLDETQTHLIEMSKNLTNEQKAFADRVGTLYDAIADEALGDEVIFNTLNNFVARSWVRDKKTQDLLSTLTQTTVHAKERRLPTIVEGWTEGLTMRSHSIVDNLVDYRDTMIKTIEQKRFINNLAEGKTEGGNPIFTTERTPGYERINMPNYTSTISYKKDGKNVTEKATYFAPRSIARRVNKIFGLSKIRDLPMVEQLTRFNAMLKKIQLSTSFFHNIAFMRSYYLGGKTARWNNMNFFTAHREGVEMIHNMDEIVKLGVANGLTLNLIQDWETDLVQIGNDIKRITNRHTKSKRVRALVSDLWRRQIEFTFGVQGAGLKIKAFQYEFQNEMKRYPNANRNEVAARVASLMNDDFGGLHLGRLEANPTIQHAFQLVALAPDWTRSNIRTVTGMFRRAEKGGYTAQRQLYKRFWARIVLKTAMATTILNIALAGGDVEEAYERWEEGVAKDWKNVASVDITPLWGLFGQHPQDRKYFSIAGHFLDPVKYTDIALGEPKILQHKSSILARLFHDWLYNENWRGQRFKNLGEIPGGVTEFMDYFDPNTYVTYRPEPRKGGFEFQHFSFPSFLISETLGTSPIAMQNLLAWLSGEQDGLSAMSNTLGVRQPITKQKPRR